MNSRLKALACGVVVAAGLSASCKSPAQPSEAVTTVAEAVETSSDIRTETTYVIRDAQTLRQVWQQLFHGRREVPAIDFTTQMVVIVALGEKPTAGYGAKITGFSRNGGGIVVHVTAFAPGAGCATATVLTYPVAVARLRSHDGPVRFDFTRTTRDCTGR